MTQVLQQNNDNAIHRASSKPKPVLLNTQDNIPAVISV